MNATIDLKALEKAATILHDIEPILDKLNAAYPALQLIKELGSNSTLIPIEDRFLKNCDAAKFLSVSPSTISILVKHGKLTPYYVNSEQRRFKLSELKALAKTEAWRVEES